MAWVFLDHERGEIFKIRLHPFINCQGKLFFIYILIPSKDREVSSFSSYQILIFFKANFSMIVKSFECPIKWWCDPLNALIFSYPPCNDQALPTVWLIRPHIFVTETEPPNPNPSPLQTASVCFSWDKILRCFTFYLMWGKNILIICPYIVELHNGLDT